MRKNQKVSMPKYEYTLCCLAFALGAGLGFIPYVKFFAWIIPLGITICYRKNHFVKGWALQATTLYTMTTILYLIIYFVLLLIKPNCSYVYETIASITCHGSLIWWLIVSLVEIVLSFLIACITLIIIIRIGDKELYSLPVIGTINNSITSGIDKIKEKWSIHHVKKK